MKLSSWKLTWLTWGNRFADLLDLVDHVAGAGMADLLVQRVVGDELGVAAEACSGTGSRSTTGWSSRDRRWPGSRPCLMGTKPAVLVDALPGAAVLREGERLHLVLGHEGAEPVANDLLALLEPDVATPVWSRPSLSRPYSSWKANSPSPVQMASTSVRMASSGWMIGWMPPQRMNVSGRAGAAAHHLAGEVGVARHRREADQVAAGQAVGDLVDLGVAQVALATVGARDRVFQTAVPVGGDVAGLGLGLELGDVGHDLRGTRTR